MSGSVALGGRTGLAMVTVSAPTAGVFLAVLGWVTARIRLQWDALALPCLAGHAGQARAQVPSVLVRPRLSIRRRFRAAVRVWSQAWFLLMPR